MSLVISTKALRTMFCLCCVVVLYYCVIRGAAYARGVSLHIAVATLAIIAWALALLSLRKP